MAVERLQEWLRQQVETGLPAFAGARVTGSVPVEVSLLNDLIARALAEAGEGTSGARDGRAPSLDVAAIARLVRHVRVDASPGVITLDFELGAGG